MNLTHLVTERARTAPDAPAISDDTSGALSNAALDGLIDRFARHFAARGVGAGDIVAAKLTNRVELIAAMFGAWRLGAALTPVNPALTAAETSYQLEDSGAKVVVALGATPDLPSNPPLLTPADVAGDAPGAELPEPETTLEDLALVIYTSGTTGRPKGSSSPTPTSTR